MKPDTTVYYGGRNDIDNPSVAGDVEVTADGATLDPAPSQRMRNHSPDGFNWGYGGSGPAQLALAICLHFLEGDALRAQLVYQDFKWQVIAPLPQLADWKLSGRQVREAIERIETSNQTPAEGGVA